MAELNTQAGIDWIACELIAQIPGKVSGRPIVRGTRIIPDGIVNSFDMGESIEDIHEDWPTLSIAQIKRLIEFAHAIVSSPIREGLA
jgi:uncharacterized protein (DUF433 family)